MGDTSRPGDAPLWQVSFLDTERGGNVGLSRRRPVSIYSAEVGITSTPVIDLKSGTLYVLACTKIRHSVGSDEYLQHLHAVAITTGVEKFGGPSSSSHQSRAKVLGQSTDKSVCQQCAGSDKSNSRETSNLQILE